MAYTLEGRENPPGEDDDGNMHPSPCIFCGQVISHIDSEAESEGGSVGWLLGALVNGEPHWYLYHNGHCPAREQDVKEHPPHGSIWRCGCSPDYVESVGTHCHECREARANCTYPCICDEILSSLDNVPHTCKK